MSASPNEPVRLKKRGRFSCLILSDGTTFGEVFVGGSKVGTVVGKDE